jgi:hypothetical protein
MQKMNEDEDDDEDGRSTILQIFSKFYQAIRRRIPEDKLYIHHS